VGLLLRLGPFPCHLPPAYAASFGNNVRGAYVRDVVDERVNAMVFGYVTDEQRALLPGLGYVGRHATRLRRTLKGTGTVVLLDLRTR
jgi:hypothetical protein